MSHRPQYRWPCQPKLKAAIFADGRPAKDIAAAAGLSAMTVSGVTTGRLRPTPNTIERLAHVLGAAPADLVDDVRVPV